MKRYLPYLSKAITALVVCAVALVAQGLLPAEVGTIITALTPFLVALGVYKAPANGPHPRETK